MSCQEFQLLIIVDSSNCSFHIPRRTIPIVDYRISFHHTTSISHHGIAFVIQMPRLIEIQMPRLDYARFSSLDYSRGVVGSGI